MAGDAGRATGPRIRRGPQLLAGWPGRVRRHRVPVAGHGNGIMLVHSATTPNAVRRTLPALDTELRAPGAAASWAAAAALIAVYAPATPAARTGLPAPPAGPRAAEETF